jgi:very-short-patch-repair endonuclease
MICYENKNKLCANNNCNICFNKSFASHSKSIYWNFEKNNNINPRNVFKNSHNKYYFICIECKHIFIASLDKINNNRWCSYCSNNKLCNEQKCKICFEKSFASHPKTIYWNYEKNNNINPKDVFKNSTKKYYFDCIKCNHVFYMALDKINIDNNWCSYCANKNLCYDTKCKLCFDKSFASHHKVKYWNFEKNNNINPRKIFKNSKKKYYFKCKKCNHSFDISLNNLNIGKQWCSYCSNKKLCNDINCNICFDKSFASHSKVKYWNHNKNNNINPRNVFKNSANKYYFECNECDTDFIIALKEVNKGSWCSLCKYKTEKIIYDFLLINSFNVKKEATFNWCKNVDTNKNYKFDFYIEEYKLIIELDGIQHFQNIKHWKNDYIKNQKDDKFKIKCAIDNGFSVIRILQEDVFYNKYEWKKELLVNIKKYIKPEKIFICKNNEYYNYIN